MKKATLLGLLSSCLGLIGIILLLAGGSHFPVYQWPYEALQGLVFFVVWGFGFPIIIGYVVALLIIAIVLMACFYLGKKLSVCFGGSNTHK